MLSSGTSIFKILSTVLCVLFIAHLLFLMYVQIFPSDSFDSKKRQRLPIPYHQFNLQGLKSNKILVAKINSSEQKTFTADTRVNRYVLKRRLPSCLIVGFAKCGTTALKTFLTLHSQVVAPMPEIVFFSVNYNRGFEWYRQQMPPSLPYQLTLEKTPSYVRTISTLKRIQAFNSSIKLMVIMTDPIIRCQSCYARNLVHKPVETSALSFEQWLEKYDILGNYGYFKSLKNLYAIFPSRQILAVDGDAMKRNPLPVLQEVETFLGLAPEFDEKFFIYDRKKGFYCVNFTRVSRGSLHRNLDPETGCFSSSKGREHPPISEDLLQRMIRAYRDHNNDVFQLIGKTFDWIGSYNGVGTRQDTAQNIV